MYSVPQQCNSPSKHNEAMRHLTIEEKRRRGKGRRSGMIGKRHDSVKGKNKELDTAF